MPDISADVWIAALAQRTERSGWQVSNLRNLLGKQVLYQLSYIRMSRPERSRRP